MNKTQLQQWFQEQQSSLEQIILRAGEAFLRDHQTLPNFGYDLSCAQQEAYNLMNNQDLCYDRYTTPFAYSLWYQARRINIFISSFIDKVHEACTSNVPITIFDLGAGTGCVQFCFAICAAAFKRQGFTLPMLRIINVDLSPFMLQYLQKYLWPEAAKHYPEIQGIAVEYHVYSWSNRADVSITNPWVCASYLFDSSDNEDYLQTNFTELISAFNPSKILLLTSSQPHKENLMRKLTSTMKSVGYNTTSTTAAPMIFNGPLQAVSNFRASLVTKYNLRASTGAVNWSDRSFSTIGLEKIQSGLGFDTRTLPEAFDLFNPPLKVRREVVLNDSQHKAAQFEIRPSIITGPAGCGKSVVLTEKIINVIEKYKWNQPLSLLVTTFNKDLLKQLRFWITDLIQANNKPVKQWDYKVSNNVSDGTGEITTGDQSNIIIKFVHFEMLGNYIGGIKYTPFDETSHIVALNEFVSQVRSELDLKSSEMTDVLTPAFLLEEYHRVIYGLQCKIALGESYYQEFDRVGRGKKLDRGRKRKAVWMALAKYAHWMNSSPLSGQSYLARRQLFYNKLKRGEIQNLFDYVFVDEFQDCTRADFQLMNMMVRDSNKLVFSGDLAQAVHIGQSGAIPKDEGQKRYKYHRLNGSYRLPYRISEAVSPLSREIANNSSDQEVTCEISPYKGAPPGARPIVVFGKNDEELAAKIVTIKKMYSVFDLHTITILEKDSDLCKAIRLKGESIETTTILRLKGLEKEFIVWSLQADIEYENEFMEFAYTIMTRTNCILLLAVTPKCKTYNANIIDQLRQDRLIFWDKESSQARLLVDLKNALA